MTAPDLLRSIVLPGTVWGTVRLAPVPITDGKWGVLEPLRGTVWGDALPVVSGEIMSFAMHGHTLPLLRVLGRPPAAMLKTLPQPFRTCRNSKTCGSFRAEDCHPTQKMPDCYEPPGLEPDAQIVASLVAMAWRDGVYVVLVDGAEFSL